MSKEVLIDSNIIIYSINSNAPYHKESLTIVQELEFPVISIQNYTEALKVLTDPRYELNLSISEAKDKLKPLIDVARIIYPDIKSFAIFNELVSKYEIFGIKLYDANLVATMLANEIYTIATMNTKDFKKYKSITISGAPR